MTTQKKKLDQTRPVLLHAPTLQIEEEKQQQLTDILSEQELVFDPENPTTICAWTYADQNGGTGDLLLFLNGGDDEEGGVLFFRRTRDRAGNRQEFVSLPDPWHQARLRGLASWQSKADSHQLYERMAWAAQRVLTDPQAWRELAKDEDETETDNDSL